MEIKDIPAELTSYHLAVFAYDVYKDLSTTKMPKDWKVLNASSYYEELRKEGYIGIAYHNTITKKIVIAHRGTDEFWKDIVDEDFWNIYLHKSPPAQIEYARKFTQKIKEEYPEPEYEIIAHTGHSLGAILAEVTSAIFKTKAITFDSPGSKEILNRTIEDSRTVWEIFWTKLPPLGYSVEDYAKLNTLTFNSSPNQINTVNTQVGSVIRLYPSYDIEKTKDNYGIIYFDNGFTFQQHSIYHLMNCFNPSTGLPKVYSTPSSWPTDGKAWFMDYRSNPHYWNEIFDQNLVSPVDGPNGEEYTDFSTKESRESYINTKLGGMSIGSLNSQVHTTIYSDGENEIFGAPVYKTAIYTEKGDETIHAHGNYLYTYKASGTEGHESNTYKIPGITSQTIVYDMVGTENKYEIREDTLNNVVIDNQTLLRGLGDNNGRIYLVKPGLSMTRLLSGKVAQVTNEDGSVQHNNLMLGEHTVDFGDVSFDPLDNPALRYPTDTSSQNLNPTMNIELYGCSDKKIAIKNFYMQGKGILGIEIPMELARDEQGEDILLKDSRGNVKYQPAITNPGSIYWMRDWTDKTGKTIILGKPGVYKLYNNNYIVFMREYIKKVDNVLISQDQIRIFHKDTLQEIKELRQYYIIDKPNYKRVDKSGNIEYITNNDLSSYEYVKLKNNKSMFFNRNLIKRYMGRSKEHEYQYSCHYFMIDQEGKLSDKPTYFIKDYRLTAKSLNLALDFQDDIFYIGLSNYAMKFDYNGNILGKVENMNLEYISSQEKITMFDYTTKWGSDNRLYYIKKLEGKSIFTYRVNGCGEYCGWDMSLEKPYKIYELEEQQKQVITPQQCTDNPLQLLGKDTQEVVLNGSLGDDTFTSSNAENSITTINSGQGQNKYNISPAKNAQTIINNFSGKIDLREFAPDGVNLASDILSSNRRILEDGSEIEETTLTLPNNQIITLKNISPSQVLANTDQYFEFGGSNLQMQMEIVNDYKEDVENQTICSNAQISSYRPELTLKISKSDVGKFNFPEGYEVIENDDNYSITLATANASDFIQNITFTPIADSFKTANFSISVNDGYSELTQNLAIKGIDIAEPTYQLTNNAQNISFNQLTSGNNFDFGIETNDSNATKVYKLKIQAPVGATLLQNGDDNEEYEENTNTLTLTGTKAQINEYLSNLQIQYESDFNQEYSIDFELSSNDKVLNSYSQKVDYNPKLAPQIQKIIEDKTLTPENREIVMQICQYFYNDNNDGKELECFLEEIENDYIKATKDGMIQLKDDEIIKNIKMKAIARLNYDGERQNLNLENFQNFLLVINGKTPNNSTDGEAITGKTSSNSTNGEAINEKSKDGFNYSMTIGLIVLGVAVVAGGVCLYKNWDKIKNSCKSRNKNKVQQENEEFKEAKKQEINTKTTLNVGRDQFNPNKQHNSLKNIKEIDNNIEFLSQRTYDGNIELKLENKHYPLEHNGNPGMFEEINLSEGSNQYKDDFEKESESSPKNLPEENASEKLSQFEKPKVNSRKNSNANDITKKQSFKLENKNYKNNKISNLANLGNLNLGNSKFL